MLDDNFLNILEKLSKITKYCIVSPIEILYKQKYKFAQNISKEKDICQIYLMEFYENIWEKQRFSYF